MFRNYFKTAWRNILNSKVYSSINILGLSAGMAVALIIGLWVYYEYSYDRFLPGYENVYQARFRFSRNGDIQTINAVALPLAGAIQRDVPGVQYVVQADWMGSHDLVAGEKKLYINGAIAGEDFLKMFPYQLVKGSPSLVLKDPYSIVLTESTAKSLFGNDDPINKLVRIDNLHDVKVTGIVKDVPGNSTFQFNFIVPFKYLVQTDDWVKGASEDWGTNAFQLFVALQPNVSYAQVEPYLKAIAKKYTPDDVKTVKSEVFMQPMKDWHLYSDFKNGVASGGFIDYVRMFSIIGILVLLIACINFMNLSTARSEKRAREVGVRKAIGSQRKDLILQFLIESVVITFIAFLVSVLIVQLVLPAFNTLTKSKISIPFTNLLFWAIMIGYVLITGLLAGSRPAFYLSSFNPVKVLKGNIQVGRYATLPRKIMVVMQFTCSIALIISTIIIYQQIQYAKNRPMGYDASRLLLSDGSSDLKHNYAALQTDLLRSGTVSSVTRASANVTELNSYWSINDWQGKFPNETLGIAAVFLGDNYFQTLGMKIVQGRNFAGNLAADSLDVILNEAAVKRFRFKDPINQIIKWNNNKPIRVVGIVKDALMKSPFSPAEPTLFIYHPDFADNIMYRILPTVKTADAIKKLTQIFNKYNPSFPYIYHFADDNYANKFDLENLIGKLAGLFAGLAIMISCLGLFGLAAYVAEQRSKEIGIRKVLGATVSQLWMLLSKDFLLLVTISCILASPIALYFLQGWLLKYDYRISIGPLVFIASATVAIAITILTISFQAIKAALANPVKSLKAE